MDFTQICMNSIYGHENKPKEKLRPYPYFQGHIKIKTAKIRAKYLNAHYLQIGSADFSQICMNLLHGHDKPHFQSHIRKRSCF